MEKLTEYNAKALLEQIKAIEPQTVATRSLKNGLRNAINDCRELGHAPSGAMRAAIRYLRKRG